MKQLKLLLIEDRIGEAEELSRHLTSCGYSVEVRKTADASADIDSAGFDAVISGDTSEAAKIDALAESEEDYRGLVKAMTAYVWQLDERGNLKEFPRWWVDLTGQGYEESRNYGWTEFIHPEDREDVKEKYVIALETKTPVALTLRLRDKAGSYRWYTARGLPFFRPDGSFRKWICTLS